MARLVTDGSSALDDEDRETYRERFGLTYRFVQWQPHLPARAERRQAARRQRLRNDGRRRVYA